MFAPLNGEHCSMGPYSGANIVGLSGYLKKNMIQYPVYTRLVTQFREKILLLINAVLYTSKWA